MSTTDIERLRSIKTFPSLVKYLRDDLDWPIESDDFDELTFDHEPEELGLDAKTAVNVKDIKQLRPLAANQPWLARRLRHEVTLECGSEAAAVALAEFSRSE